MSGDESVKVHRPDDPHNKERYTLTTEKVATANYEGDKQRPWSAFVVRRRMWTLGSSLQGRTDGNYGKQMGAQRSRGTTCDETGSSSVRLDYQRR